MLILYALPFTLYSCNQKVIKESSEIKDDKYPNFNFESDFYDFGNIKNGDTVVHSYVFANDGPVPLIISDISTSCGCTVSKWNNKPILPNMKDSIIVQFSKKHDLGIHQKILVIKANTKDPYTVLKFRANINK